MRGTDDRPVDDDAVENREQSSGGDRDFGLLRRRLAAKQALHGQAQFGNDGLGPGRLERQTLRNTLSCGGPGG